MFALEKRRKPAGFAPSCRFATRPSIRAGAERQTIPVGDLLFGAGFENHIGHTLRGDVPLHPGGFSEAELMFAHGSAHFASKDGRNCRRSFPHPDQGPGSTGRHG
jgi:hypothetical protein